MKKNVTNVSKKVDFIKTILNTKVKDIDKLNEVKNNGFNILGINIPFDEEIHCFIGKPYFYEISHKVSSIYFSPHYSNFTGLFTLGKITNNNLSIVPIFIGNNHTSCNVGKYPKVGYKKTINDYFIKENSNNDIQTTLIPTDAHYVLSRMYEGKFGYEYDYSSNLHLSKNGLFFKKSPTRLGDQSEILKHNSILKNFFNMNSYDIPGLIPGTRYIFKSSQLESFLKKNNIHYNPLELDCINTYSDFEKIQISKKDPIDIILKKNDVKILKVKVTPKDLKVTASDVIYGSEAGKPFDSFVKNVSSHDLLLNNNAVDSINNNNDGSDILDINDA